MLDRIPPHNIDYERCVIYDALAGDMDSIEHCVDVLLPEHFYRTLHQNIWKAVVELHKSGTVVDLLTVSKRVSENGTAMASDLAEVTTNHYCSPSHTHVADTIKGLALMRGVIERSNAIIFRAYENQGEYGKVIDYAQQQMRNIDSVSESVHRMDQMMMEAMDRYDSLRNGKCDGLKTGFYELDYLTGGLIGSLLIVLAARPGIGKTAMMCTISRNMAKIGIRVGIFSLEMDKESLIDRIVSMETGINSLKLRTGNGPTKDEWLRITNAGSRISEWPIRIDDTGGLQIGELRRRCRSMCKAGAQIIFIDQLSKILGGDGRSEYEKRSSVVNQLADLKKELRIPIVLLAQINRMGEPDPPFLSHLKSTGSLEEDADMVLLGHRRHPYEKKNTNQYINDARWELAKHRGGMTRVLQMWWEPGLTMFTNMPQSGDRYEP
jgi:replicative DNA helicase